jgi:hypothetical protein
MRWPLAARTNRIPRRRALVLRRQRFGFDRLEDRLAPSGDLGFAIGIGSTGTDIATSVATDRSGNVYVTGTFQGTVNFNPDPNGTAVTLTSNGADDVFVAKYSGAGALLWAKSVSATGDSDEGNDVSVNDTGYVFVTGAFSGTANFGGTVLSSGTYPSLFVASYDSSGNLRYADALSGTDAGGSGRGVEVVADASNNTYVTGSITGTVNFNRNGSTTGSGVLTAQGGNANAFVMALDYQGRFGWAKTFGDSAGDFGQAIAVDYIAGAVYATGMFNATATFDGTTLTSAGDLDAYVAKLDGITGSVIWAKGLGGTGTDEGTGIAVDSSSNVYTTGFFQNTADFDPGTSTANLTSRGNWDVYVSKLNSQGNYVWAKSFGSAGVDNSYGLALDGAGNVYVAGGFSGTVDFDPGAGVYNLSEAGQGDAFVSKLDPSGNFSWASRLGGSAFDLAEGVAVSPLGAVYVAGRFQGTADFDPGIGTDPISTRGSDDIFLTRLVQSSSLIQKATADGFIAYSGTTVINATHSEAGKSLAEDGVFLDGDTRDRGLFEFDISALPANAMIVSAIFQGYVNLINGTSSNITVNFYGYAGDGVVTLSDATVTTQSIGTLSGVYVGPFSKSINASFIQSLLGKSSYAGIAVTDINAYQLAFASLEETGFPPPTLYVEFTVPTTDHAPVGTNDTYAALAGATLAVPAGGVLANDSDADHNPLSAILVTPPSHGTLALNADGSFIYTPFAGYTGPDSFTYFANDGQLSSASPATVSITVNPVDHPPVASNDSYATSHDTPLVVSGASASPGALLRYGFDESGPSTFPALDGGSAPGAPGTFVGAATRTANTPGGASAGALDLSAGNGYVTAGDAGKLDHLGAITVSAWINLRAAPSDQAVLMSDDPFYGTAPVGNGGWELRIAKPFTNSDPISASNFAIQFQVYQDMGSFANGQAITSSALNADNQWLFVAATFDSGNTVRLYAGTSASSASLVGQGIFAYSLGDNAAPFEIGASALNNNPNQTPPPAWIDDVRVYGSALGAAQVDQVRREGLARGVLSNDTDPDGDPLTAAVVSGPSHGSLTLNSDGTFRYIPAASYVGTDGFTYKASDGTLDSNVATATISVTATDRPPTAVGDSYSISQGKTLTVAGPGVLGNDGDPDGDPIVAVWVSGPANGSLTLNADGSFTYTPSASFSGVDGFSYQDSDGQLTGNVATVTLIVNPHIAPAAAADSYITVKNVALTVSAPGILANDTVTPGYPLSASVVAKPSHGTLALNADGSFTYTPTANYTGTDSFTYRANDGTFNSGTATVNLTVYPPPSVSSSIYDMAENTSLAVAMPGALAYATDPIGRPLTAILVSGPSHGTATLNPNGSFVYTPLPGYLGQDKFTFKASDGVFDSNIADVAIATYEPPVAVDHAYTTNMGQTLAVSSPGLLDGASNPSGLPLSAAVGTNPAHGTLSLSTNGTFIYTPASGFYGTDSFTYKLRDNGVILSNIATVTLTVLAPPFAAPHSYTALQGTPLVKIAPGVLAGATDVKGLPLTAILVTNPRHGTLALNGDGSFTYTIAPGYFGTDSFTYKVNDGQLDSNAATVSLTDVAPPAAAADSYTIAENSTLTTVVGINSLVVNSQPGDYIGAGGSYSYGPNDGTYTTSRNLFSMNGVGIHFTPTSNPDAAWDFNFAAPYKATIVPGTYLNATRFPFEDASVPGLSITYDHRGSNTLTGQFTVYQAVYDGSGKVVSFDASFEQHSDGATPALTGRVQYRATLGQPAGVLVNDFDPQNYGLSSTLVSGPSHGTLGLKTDGSFTYSPDANFVGTDSFTYKANDGTLDSNVATATINVIPTTSASFVAADAATQGNWRSSYGGDGYDIPADNSAANPVLPAYAQVAVSGAGAAPWTSSTADPRALQNAASSGRIASGWFGSTMTFDISLTDGQAHKLALYALDWDGYGGGRSERIDVLDAATNAVLSTQTISSFGQGEYLSWNIAGHVKIVVTNLNAGSNAVVNGLFFGAAASTGNSAGFLGTDAATQGNWRSAYGGDGYDIPADSSGPDPALPSYAQVVVAGGGPAAWTTSTADPRALQNAANNGRISSAWFGSTLTFDVSLTDGQSHKLALYALDWDGYGGGRSERVDVLDAATNAVLSTQTISSFGQGVYLSWSIAGRVKVVVTNLNPASNAAVNGLFFGTAAGTGNAASFLASDSATQGVWRSAYGHDGYDIPADSSAANPVLPSYAQVAVTGAGAAPWTTSTQDPRALQDAANSGRIASGWFGNTMTFDISLADGQSHRLALYALDWDGWGGGRSERVDVLDAATGVVLSTQTISSFGQGEYLAWTVTGHVKVVVTNLNGNSNAVVNGLFFGAAVSTTGNTASFLASDAATQGAWRSSYGGDGFDIAADNSAANPVLPAYAQVVVAGGGAAAWTTSTTDVRALQNAANNGRISSGWFSGSALTFDVSFTDGQAHELALYALDWDGWGGGRSERVDVLDAATGVVLSTQTISSFGQGEYLAWTVTGHVKVVVTNLNGNSNAVVNGLFFGPGRG